MNISTDGNILARLGLKIIFLFIVRNIMSPLFYKFF